MEQYNQFSYTEIKGRFSLLQAVFQLSQSFLKLKHLCDFVPYRRRAQTQDRFCIPYHETLRRIAVELHCTATPVYDM